MIFALLLLAQASSSLSGTVFNAAYAEVRLLQGEQVRAKTNATADGEYTFSKLDPGEYALSVDGRKILDLALVADSPQLLDVYDRPSTNVPGLKLDEKTMKAKLVKNVAPLYPLSARAKRIQGPVLLRVQLNPAGQVVDSEIIATPHADLAQAAQAAVQQRLYQPTLLNGNPVPVQTEVRINFTLLP